MIETTFTPYKGMCIVVKKLEKGYSVMVETEEMAINRYPFATREEAEDKGKWIVDTFLKDSE